MYLCRAALQCDNEKCNTHFDTPAQLAGHKRHAHQEWPCDLEPCASEGKTFSRKSDLDFHKGNEHLTDADREVEQHIFRCRKCRKVLKHQKSLKQHEDRCTGKMKRQCEECKEMLPSSSDVKNHIIMHQKERDREAVLEAQRREREEEEERRRRAADNDNNDNDA